MPNITVNPPPINLKAYFSFKEPFATFVKNRFNILDSKIELTVAAQIGIQEYVNVDMRDPLQDVYAPADISQFVYREDFLNNVPIVTFKFEVKDGSGVRYVRVPLSYVESYSSVLDIEYVNKLIVIDLNFLNKTVDTSSVFPDLKDFIETRLGVESEIKEVAIGEPLTVSIEENETKETIRQNLVTVKKTLTTRLAEITHKYDQLVQRLQDLNISLS